MNNHEYKNQKLKKFVNWYYNTNTDDLPSRSYLCKELNMTLGEFKTILQVFIECGYIYKTGYGYKIYKTKRDFENPSFIEDVGNYITFTTSVYKIGINKFEFSLLEPDLKVEDITDIIYLLFLFTLELKVSIHPSIEMNKGLMHYRSDCKSYIDNTILYYCIFTQEKEYIKLTNVE